VVPDHSPALWTTAAGLELPIEREPLQGVGALHGSTKVITAISASFSRASWSETRVERERSAHEFPGAIRLPRWPKACHPPGEAD
jgi:hypothetical protein